MSAFLDRHPCPEVPGDVYIWTLLSWTCLIFDGCVSAQYFAFITINTFVLWCCLTDNDWLGLVETTWVSGFLETCFHQHLVHEAHPGFSLTHGPELKSPVQGCFLRDFGGLRGLSLLLFFGIYLLMFQKLSFSQQWLILPVEREASFRAHTPASSLPLSSQLLLIVADILNLIFFPHEFMNFTLF